MNRPSSIERPAAGVPFVQRRVGEGSGFCGPLCHAGTGRGWCLDSGVSGHPWLCEPGGDPRGRARQYPRGDCPLPGGAGAAGQVMTWRRAGVYSSQTHPSAGMEVEWERSTQLSISRTSRWLNASNWPRICGIASRRTVRSSHLRLPKRQSSIDGWRSCGVAQTRASRGRSSATGSTPVCGGKLDDTSPRSARRRGGYRRSGTLVREPCVGFGQRVPWFGGGGHRRHSADAQCLSQSARGRSSSLASPLSLRALLPAGALAHTSHRMPARAARPDSLATTDRGRNRRLTRFEWDQLGRPTGPTGLSSGGGA